MSLCVFAPVKTSRPSGETEPAAFLHQNSFWVLHLMTSHRSMDHCLIGSVCPAGGWLTHRGIRVHRCLYSPVVSSQHHWRVTVLLHGPHRLRQPLVGSAHRSHTLHLTHRLVVRHFLKCQIPIILHCTAWRHNRHLCEAEDPSFSPSLLPSLLPPSELTNSLISQNLFISQHKVNI